MPIPFLDVAQTLLDWMSWNFVYDWLKLWYIKQLNCDKIYVGYN